MRTDIPYECPRVEALSLVVDNEISGSARDEIEAHAASCPLCGATLREFRELRSALAAFPDAVPGVDIATLIAHRLEPRRQSRPARRRMGWHWQLAPAGLAGAGMLAMGAYLGLLLAAGTTASVARPPAVAVFSAVPPGGLCLTSACFARGR
jgi:anti-sigma factor RsiW